VVSDLYKRLMVEGGDVDSRQAEMNFRNQQRASHRAAKEWVRSGLRRHDAPILGGHLGESLVIVASDDRLLRRDALQHLVEGMPRVHYACIDDAGHGWNEGLSDAACRRPAADQDPGRMIGLGGTVTAAMLFQWEKSAWPALDPVAVIRTG
jgi:dienelactone hydrolase